MQKINQPLPVTGTFNTRDIGGYTGLDGRQVASHRLIRSDSLWQLTPEDVTYLVEEIGVRTVVDFRGTAEMGQQPDVVLPGVQVIHLPILRDWERRQDQAGMSLADKMRTAIEQAQGDIIADTEKVYYSMTKDMWAIGQYRRFFEILLEQEDGAVLWHCAAGKDRTGAAAIAILMALGVDDETVVADYLASTDYLMPMADYVDGKMVEAGADDALRSQVRLMCGVAPELYTALMKGIADNWGDRDNYMRNALGLTSAKLRAFKEKYLK